MIHIKKGNALAAESTGAFRALRHRNFRLFWIGFLVSNSGAWIQTVAQGWLVYDISGNAVYLGLTGFIRAIPLITLSLVGGSFADRFDRKRLLYVTQSVMMVTSFILGLLTWLGEIQVWHVFLLAAVSASAQAFDQPTRQSLIPTLVPKQDLYAAISINAIAFQGSTVFGPSLTGILVPAVGLAGCFFVNTVSFGSVFLALHLMEFPAREGARKQGSVLADIVEGFRFVRQSPVILGLILMAAINSFAARPYQQFITVFARDVLGGNEGTAGYLTAAPGVGTILFSVAVASLSHLPYKGRILIGSGLGFTAMLIGFAWSGSFWLSMLLLAFVGGLNTTYQTTTNTLLQSTAPEEMRGRIMSFFTITALAMMPLGQGPMGVSMEALGPRWALTVGALVSGGSVAVLSLLIPRLRRLS